MRAFWKNGMISKYKEFTMLLIYVIGYRQPSKKRVTSQLGENETFEAN